ncbi:MAG: DALR domain-containing protein, partial [Spirochaetota bacterium]|nr:DALR domain-containing protein [Spirochaetota bacterium]
IDNFFASFTETVDNDLNISGGLGIFFEFLHEINTQIDRQKISKEDVQLIMKAIKKIDSVFGFIFTDEKQGDLDVQRIEKLISERKEARNNKDFTRADEIRNKLLDEGIILEDTKDGTRWKKKR